MKNVGICQNCGRKVYTNDIDLCKRCYQEVGIEFLNTEEVIEEEPEEPVALEDLGLEPGAEETEESSEETEEETKESKEEKAEEKKE